MEVLGDAGEGCSSNSSLQRRWSPIEEADPRRNRLAEEAGPHPAPRRHCHASRCPAPRRVLARVPENVLHVHAVRRTRWTVMQCGMVRLAVVTVEDPLTYLECECVGLTRAIATTSGSIQRAGGFRPEPLYSPAGLGRDFQQVRPHQGGHDCDGPSSRTTTPLGPC